MKVSIKTALFSLLLGVSLLFYLWSDKKSYEYGFGCNFCNISLPYNLNPHDGSDFSFTLNDVDGFELVGIGFRFYGSKVTIKDFLAYGYNDTSVIVKCTDSLNAVKYLTSYKTKYKNKEGNPEISFMDLSNSHFEQIKNNYNWVEVDEEKANTIQFMKFLSMLGAVLSLIFIIWRLFKLRRNKAA